ncbi:MAG: hypothetical protein WBQ42_00550 [Candidatus Rickettsiella isopodorum]
MMPSLSRVPIPTPLVPDEMILGLLIVTIPISFAPTPRESSPSLSISCAIDGYAWRTIAR